MAWDELPQLLWIVLGLLGVLMLMILIIQFSILGRLKRLELKKDSPRQRSSSKRVESSTEPMLISQPEDLDKYKPPATDQELPEGVPDGSKLVAKSGGSSHNFEEFLKEDPTRLMLSKSEQAAAFRKWRSEKGLNWSK